MRSGDGEAPLFDARTLRPRPAIRPARHDDVAGCAEVWREAVAHYLGRLNRLPPGGDLASLRRVMDHLLGTDPDRFWVAERADEGRIVGFASATVRGDTWFLALLFVVPDEQGLGLGSGLLERTMASLGSAVRRATVTDSAQPVSNGMYGRIGIVPRMPLLHLLGPADEVDPLPRLPSGIAARPMDELVPDGGEEAVTMLDRQLLGYARPADHEFFWRDGRRGFVFEDEAGRAVAYGYAAPSGRVGPVAALDESLLVPVIGDLLAAVPPLDASSVWCPGASGMTVSTLLRAGFRLDGFPALLAWDRPFGAFERYLPASLALF